MSTSTKRTISSILRALLTWCLCILFVGGQEAKACCGVQPYVAPSAPGATYEYGKTVLFRGVITGVEQWPGAMSVGPVSATIEVRLPSGATKRVTPQLTYKGLVPGANPKQAKYDYSYDFKPTEVGPHTYAISVTWTSAYNWVMGGSAGGSFAVTATVDLTEVRTFADMGWWRTNSHIMTARKAVFEPRWTVKPTNAPVKITKIEFSTLGQSKTVTPAPLPFPTTWKWSMTPAADTAHGIKDLVVTLYWESKATSSYKGQDNVWVISPQRSGCGAKQYKLYFNKDATNDNDGGNAADPNWYNHWTHTSATFGTHQYNANLLDADGQYSLRYDPPLNTFFEIGPSAATSNNGIYSGFSQGIDNFACTCRHENRHMTYSLANWAGGYKPALDVDGDGLRDDTEVLLGYDPTLPDTDGDGQNDFEDLAQQAETTWTKGSGDASDWANPGKQSVPAF